MTNYEWIKSLSVDEMAERLIDLYGSCVVCAHYRKYKRCLASDCKEGMKLYLNDEHKES